VSGFTWHDGERTIVFGAGAADSAVEYGFDDAEVLTTTRERVRLPEFFTGPVHEIPSGQVPELASDLLEQVAGVRVVAWGGGRVIDAAKALASALGGLVCAVPTTLSGAEMSHGHRQIPGYEQEPHARPVLVLADPALMTSLPEPALRASAMNAMAHAAEALYTPDANPVASLAALRGAALLAGEDRALGSILAGYALDSAGLALHHILCQTIVRTLGTPHAQTNACMLPHTVAFMRDRAQPQLEELSEALGTDLAGLPGRLDQLGGHTRVELPADQLPGVADATLRRGDLARTPGAPLAREDLLGILASASDQ
jgi:alcohol dehydrogenase class IV